MKENATTYQQEKTLKDLILKVREYIIYLWKKKFWIVGAAILSAGLFVWRVSDNQEIFAGSLSFVVNESATSSGGGVAAALGQIGIGNSSSEYNLTKIVTLSKTRQIISRMLLDSAMVGGQNDLMGNHLIRIHNLHERFEKIGKRYEGFYFKHNRQEEFSRVENQVVKLLFLQFISNRDPLLTVTHSDETGIVLMEAHAHSEGLTQMLLFKVFEALRDFYVDNATSQHQATLDQLTEKADSVFAALNQTEYRLAQLEDRSLGISSRSSLIKIDQLQRKASLLNSMYIEVLRNQEAADFLLKSTKPALRIVDPPIVPLASLEADYKVSTVLGLIFGGFVMSMLLLLRKGYLEIVA